jgi:hypothetical protein
VEAGADTLGLGYCGSWCAAGESFETSDCANGVIAIEFKIRIEGFWNILEFKHLCIIINNIFKELYNYLTSKN